MKKVTREEEQEYLSDLFNLMTEVPKSEYEYLGDSIREWFAGHMAFSKLKVSDQETAVRLLFDAKRIDNDQDKQIRIICEFLEATSDSKYIELSKKIPVVKNTEPRDFQDSTEAARMLLTRYSKGDGIYTAVQLGAQVKMSYRYGNPKIVTIGKELQEIRRTGKKIPTEHKKAMKRYKNIASIDFSDLYSSVAHFLYYHGGSPDWEDYSKFEEKLAKGRINITEIVQNKQSAAIEMLNYRQDLQFVQKQPQGKIR